MERLFQATLWSAVEEEQEAALRTPNFANGNVPKSGIWAGLGHPMVDVEVRDRSDLQPVLEGTQMIFNAPSRRVIL